MPAFTSLEEASPFLKAILDPINKIKANIPPENNPNDHACKHLKYTLEETHEGITERLQYSPQQKIDLAGVNEAINTCLDALKKACSATRLYIDEEEIKSTLESHEAMQAKQRLEQCQRQIANLIASPEASPSSSRGAEAMQSNDTTSSDHGAPPLVVPINEKSLLHVTNFFRGPGYLYDAIEQRIEVIKTITGWEPSQEESDTLRQKIRTLRRQHFSGYQKTEDHTCDQHGRIRNLPRLSTISEEMLTDPDAEQFFVNFTPLKEATLKTIDELVEFIQSPISERLKEIVEGVIMNARMQLSQLETMGQSPTNSMPDTERPSETAQSQRREKRREISDHTHPPAQQLKTAEQPPERYGSDRNDGPTP